MHPASLFSFSQALPTNAEPLGSCCCLFNIVCGDLGCATNHQLLSGCKPHPTSAAYPSSALHRDKAVLLVSLFQRMLDPIFARKCNVCACSCGALRGPWPARWRGWTCHVPCLPLPGRWPAGPAACAACRVGSPPTTSPQAPRPELQPSPGLAAMSALPAGACGAQVTSAPLAWLCVCCSWSRLPC